MKKFHKFLALAALTPFLAACAPSNEDVCGHVMEIMKKEMGDAKEGPSDEDIKKIWGGNLLRVWREVERVAAEIQGSGN